MDRQRTGWLASRRKAALIAELRGLSARVLGGTLSCGPVAREAHALQAELHTFCKLTNPRVRGARALLEGLRDLQRLEQEVAAAVALANSRVLDVDPDGPAVAAALVHAAARWDDVPETILEGVEAVRHGLERIRQLVTGDVVRHPGLRGIRSRNNVLRGWVMVAYDAPDVDTRKRFLQLRLGYAGDLWLEHRGRDWMLDGRALIESATAHGQRRQLAGLALTPAGHAWSRIDLAAEEPFRAYVPNTELDSLARFGRELL